VPYLYKVSLTLLLSDTYSYLAMDIFQFDDMAVLSN
jgi:hypothetical protein